MSRVRSKDTKPELLIRKSLHAQGFRYRLHGRGIPGKPDIVFPRYESVVFVNGCFWHGHGCRRFSWPSSNTEFWKSKIGQNIVRDKENMVRLEELGWRVLIVWECAIRGRKRWAIEVIVEMIADWLLSGSVYLEIAEKETD